MYTNFNIIEGFESKFDDKKWNRAAGSSIGRRAQYFFKAKYAMWGIDGSERSCKQQNINAKLI